VRGEEEESSRKSRPRSRPHFDSRRGRAREAAQTSDQGAKDGGENHLVLGSGSQSVEGDLGRGGFQITRREGRGREGEERGGGKHRRKLHTPFKPFPQRRESMTSTKNNDSQEHVGKI